MSEWVSESVSHWFRFRFGDSYRISELCELVLALVPALSRSDFSSDRYQVSDKIKNIQFGATLTSQNKDCGAGLQTTESDGSSLGVSLVCPLGETEPDCKHPSLVEQVLAGLQTSDGSRLDTAPPAAFPLEQGLQSKSDEHFDWTSAKYWWWGKWDILGFLLDARYSRTIFYVNNS